MSVEQRAFHQPSFVQVLGLVDTDMNEAIKLIWYLKKHLPDQHFDILACAVAIKRHELAGTLDNEVSNFNSVAC